METEIAAAWTLRRVGFGATSFDLDRAGSIGLDAFVDELFDPSSRGVPDDGDPWQGVDLPLRFESPRDIAPPIAAWLTRMATASRPVSEWLAWYWHGHLVTSLTSVRSPLGLVNQIRLFRDLGRGPFAPLLRAITIDAAMLRYLDGDRSTGTRPNENYSRELLELFALGVGNYSEADVVAGARALTGWTRPRGTVDSVLVARRHDDSPQDYLGESGVNDVDSVIDAVTSHPACARFIARSLAETILGAGVAVRVETAEAEAFANDGLDVAPLIRRLVERGLAGEHEPVVLAPVPWIVAAVRSTDADLDLQNLAGILRSGGQVPFLPPNVAGWPTGEAWLSSSAVVARLEAARIIAEAAAADGVALRAAEVGDLDDLARALGRPEGFSLSTSNALLAADVRGRTLLTLALSTPDLVIA